MEFDKTGAHAVLSIWDKDGAVIIYDAKTQVNSIVELMSKALSEGLIEQTGHM